MTRARRLTAPCVTAVLIALLIGTTPFSLAQTPPPPSQSGFVYNGITHVSFFFDEYNNFGQPTGQGTDSRTELAATNASWAGVLATWYQANATATVISADSNRTPTDQAVIFAINELHAKGLKVMLKPHVDSEDGAWRGTFQPFDVDAWFKSFTAFITHYAQLAQAQNVELLCFGTEYVQLSGGVNQARWDAVIAAIRQVYTGKLTYAANATFTGDEFTSVSFWDKVDLLGIDGYFPLTNHADPTLAELVGAWRNNEFGEDLVATVQNFADAHQKPLIFTELGYKSVAGANTQPFNFTFPGAFDLIEQQNCYTAFYTVWSPENSWMLGIFWWAWPVPPPAANDTDYNPRSKPAENVLKTFQGAPSGAASFNLAANPESISLAPGGSQLSTIAINPSGGFNSPVTLSVSGLPTGVTASVSPATVTGATSSITFNVASTVPAGTVATLTVTGTGGGITSALPIKLAVVNPDFSLSASPSQTNVHQGASATSTVDIGAIAGFAGNVTFSATNLPSGVTATFSPASVSGSSFSVVTFTASAGAALSSSAVAVTGTSGSLSHTTTINLTVQAPVDDFSLSADSPTMTQGSSGSTTVTVTPMGIFNGSVALSAGGLPGGVTATFSPASTTTTSTLTFTATATASLGIATISITGTSGNISHTITIHLTVNQVQNQDFSLSASPANLSLGVGCGNGTSVVSVSPSGGFTGSVALSASGLPPGVTANFNPASTTGSSTVTFTASSTATVGTANVTITGTSGNLTHTTTIALTVTAAQPDFSLSSSPATLTLAQGGTGTSTITVASSSCFTGSVTLAASGLPSGVTASFSPASTTRTSTLTLTASATATAGPATVTITGTSGTLTHTTTIALVTSGQPDFSLSANPGSLSVAQGTSGTSTITVTPINGFTGTVALSANGLPAGVTASFSPASTSGTSTLTLTASSTATAGPATVTVTGTSGTLTHTTTIALTVGCEVAFSLSATPTSLSVAQGASGSSTITLTPSSCFTGAVAFAASGLPAGVTASFNPASTTTGTSTVTFTASTTAAVGSFNVTVTGTSGTLSQSTTIALTVTPVQPDFSLSASPASVSLAQGTTGSSTITVKPVNGFTGAVALAASGLPAGVTASFNPASTTGTSTLTFTTSSTVAPGVFNVMVTGTNGTLSHTAMIALTITVPGNGGVTVATVINSSQPFFDDEGVKLANTGAITALSLTINVQNTGGISFNGQYNTVGGQITQSHSSTATVITYQFGLSAGQTIAPGSYLFDAQMGATGTAHPTSGDTFTVTYTTGGQTFTQTGHF